MEQEWARHGRSMLNRSILAAVLILIVLVFSAAGTIFLPIEFLIALVVGLVWLAAAYVLGRQGRLQLAGLLVVVFAILLLALGFYVLPAYVVALLPLTAIPVALAALLIRPPAAYGAAALMLLAIIVAVYLSGVAPSDPVAIPLTSSMSFGLSSAAIALLLLALMLTPSPLETLQLRQRLLQAQEARQQQDQQIQRLEQDLGIERASFASYQSAVAAMVDRLDDGLILVNAQGKIEKSNTAAQQIWAEIGDGELSGVVLSRLQAKLADGVWAEVVNLPMGSGFTHALLERRDQARYGRLRRQLVSMLADEMRNPLTSMLTALDLTLEQSDLPEDTSRVLTGARRSGHRVLDLVSILLEISQLEQNPESLHCTPTALRRLLESSIAQMSPLAQRSAVTIAVEYGSDAVLSIDSERLQRAFGYLLERALRQSPAYSTIQVQTLRQDGAIVVRISDQGPGLSDQDRRVLLDQETEEQSSSVLTLLFSKLVIERHKGRVWAESDAEHASIIAFSIPVLV